ncbi:hypothetical protein LTR10_018253 [Elasticomyces elasticus]|nr:hypothetical protein LTR10_018253 [Elasticomyces elasticus]KAK5185654.1 hypothetical protein LTR44_001703 [Eurotiomycetes sp. CCFEE 6388]
MLTSTFLNIALMAVAVSAVPQQSVKRGNSWGYGGKPAAGYNTLENFCEAPMTLECCSEVLAGAAGLPDATCLGATNTQAGGQITYEFGYCPTGYAPLCCAVVADNDQIGTGCGLPTQVEEPAQ